MDLVGSAAVFSGMLWGFLIATAHATHRDEYRFRIRSFRVLPRRVVPFYEIASMIALFVGSALLLLPITFAIRAGDLMIAGVFSTYAAGALAATANRRSGLMCGCAGGLLSADVTYATWTLPAGISLVSVLGVFSPAQSALRAEPLGLTLSIAGSALLLLIVEYFALASRRQTWISLRGRTWA